MSASTRLLSGRCSVASCLYPSPYSPDLSGCVATGERREEAERNMYEAIQMHVRGLLDDGLPVPSSEAVAEYVAIP